MTAALTVTGLDKSFGGREVLDGVELDVAAGEIVAVLGRSGGGKTTLLRVIAGLESADRGSVAIGGDDVTDLRPAERNIGMVFQDGGTLPHLSVAENIGFGLAGSRRSARRDERVISAARLTGCVDHLDRRPSELSGGERQRVALARALVRGPRLVLLDEPLSSLDADDRGRLRTALRAALVAAGTTALHVTHDQDEAFAVGDRVAVLDRGRIAQIGTADELYERPATLGVATLVGARRLNVFPAGGRGPFAPAGDAALVAAIRPAGVEVTAPDRNGAVYGTVVAVEPGERSATVHVSVGEWTVRGVIARSRRPAVGDVVSVVADPDAWLTFDAETGEARR